ncbi:MAG TPA: acetoin dehydrogenase [Acidimicrobiaceae bacterium]|jgi:short-subunit dehydrogenase|nr:acetoin dehydrogenase [Acidimicrobiaceae bacterium]
MKQFKGKVAAITGAGSGIGRALALDLASRGCHVALSDINEEALAETVSQCEGWAVKVTSQRLDVADRDAVFEWASSVKDSHGTANLIFNNAGVGLKSKVAATTMEDFNWLMNINFWGVVYGTQAFLPILEASGSGHVVNISSVFGLVSVPSQSVYNAAKFAVRGYTDALRMELEIDKSCVSATTIHPGGIKTNIARNARTDSSLPPANPDEFDKLAKTTPEQAATQILKAVQRNRRRAVIGPDGRLIDLLSRLPAVVPQKITIAAARKELKR